MSTTHGSIEEQSAAVQASQVDTLPAEVRAGFAAEQAALDAAGIPDGVAEPGSAMPDGELLDVDGQATTLEAARDGDRAVVIFYRGVWCPFCNLTLRSYEQALVGPLREQGVRLIAISPQKPDGSVSMAEAHDLTYTVLSDPGNQIASQLGVLNPDNEDARRALAIAGLDVGALNADGTDRRPMPTTVLVDADGTIAWIDVHPNYTTRSEPEEILAAVARS